MISSPPSPAPLSRPSTMDDDGSQVLGLFDLYWFHHQILRPQLPASPPPLPPSDPPPTPPQPLPNPPPLLLRRHRRSLSDESTSAPAPSASLSIHPPRLSTILSGKEALAQDLAPAAAPPAVFGETKSYAGERRRGGRARRRKKEEKSKSLTDLEFEELKGFIDLGFSFSDADTDPRLLDIVPGLRRRSRAPPEAPPGSPGETTVSRPYLSEAWEAKPEEELLKNWKFQAAGGGGGEDMKDRLRCWAHAVASTVVR